MTHGATSSWIRSYPTALSRYNPGLGEIIRWLNLVMMWFCYLVENGLEKQQMVSHSSSLEERKNNGFFVFHRQICDGKADWMVDLFLGCVINCVNCARAGHSPSHWYLAVTTLYINKQPKYNGTVCELLDWKWHKIHETHFYCQTTLKASITNYINMIKYVIWYCYE